ncbi:MAG: spore germination protein [Ruminococcaceae bacterium]|nr:spore germination protein [Oscillospiraceae bacterium]
MSKQIKLCGDYRENVKTIDEILHPERNFDILKKQLTVGKDELTLYFIDGFVKDAVMQKLMLSLVALKGLGESTDGSASRADKRIPPSLAVSGFIKAHVPYVETDSTSDVDLMIQMVLSGATLMLGTTFGEYGVIIDARTYPARETGEPEGDKVMRGARDGFVETLIFNTALIRRRIRNPHLTMSYHTVGKSSRTDVVVCYMADRADLEYVDKITKKLKEVNTDSLTMGHESLAECLIKQRWYNPFPKIRYTERPDSAAAQLLEGSILIICDNTPQIMVLPTTIFDFMQETNDFYFPPLTGTYIRIVRHVVFFMALYMVPLWLLLVSNPELIPSWLGFIVPREQGRLPLVAQILLVEFIIDGLRMASLNTPNMLSNSLSVVGGLILGDFAVDIGWLIPEVILYMAFVAIANFTQRSYELGYAFKFLRILLTVLTALFNVWGFGIGSAIILVLLVTNKTVNHKRSYLYPLIPFDFKAFKSLFVRVRKRD